MGVFTAGEVVLLLYPFSDLSRNKQRPAVVLAGAGREDWIVSQVTSNPFADPWAIPITQADFTTGGLHHVSYARPGKIFTAHESLISATLGALAPDSFDKVRNAVLELIRNG